MIVDITKEYVDKIINSYFKSYKYKILLPKVNLNKSNFMQLIVDAQKIQ